MSGANGSGGEELNLPDRAEGRLKPASQASRRDWVVPTSTIDGLRGEGLKLRSGLEVAVEAS